MANPIEQFTIKPIIPLEIGGVDLAFTNSSLFMVLGVVVAVGFFLIAARAALVPGRVQGFAEMMHEFIAKLIRDTIGEAGMPFFPLIFTIFVFVFMGNSLSMLPLGFAFTSHVVVTLALAVMVFAIVVIVGLMRHGLRFFTLFAPHGVPWYILPLLIPIEIISFLMRPFTHGVRLFVNMMAGHMVMKVFAGFIVVMLGLGGILSASSVLPSGFELVVVAFEFFVALLQAYIFTIFACIYLKDAIYLHGPDAAHAHSH